MRLRPEHRGHVVVGGAYVTYDALMRARELGVAAVVAGGLDDLDLRRLLGRDLGVAITGSEDLGLTLVLTEGFGRIRMSDRAWDLLGGARRPARLGERRDADPCRRAAARGADPRVRRVPRRAAERDAGTGLALGSLVRVIRAPHFGRVGQVVELPPELRRLETEAMVRVLVRRLPRGRRAGRGPARQRGDHRLVSPALARSR